MRSNNKQNEAIQVKPKIKKKKQSLKTDDALGTKQLIPLPTTPSTERQQETSPDLNRTATEARLEAEQNVKIAVEDLFATAWSACSERFLGSAAPTIISCDLRDTWLRAVETEWLDNGIRGIFTTKQNKIFLSDPPPLPLALDCWSRGGLQQMPTAKRESFLDPFIRNDFMEADIADKSITGHDAITQSQGIIEDHEDTPKGRKNSLDNDEEPAVQQDAENDSTGVVDGWNFDVDNMFPNILRETDTIDKTYASSESVDPESSSLIRSSSRESSKSLDSTIETESNENVEAILRPKGIFSFSTVELAVNEYLGELRTRISTADPFSRDARTEGTRRSLSLTLAQGHSASMMDDESPSGGLAMGNHSGKEVNRQAIEQWIRKLSISKEQKEADAEVQPLFTGHDHVPTDQNSNMISKTDSAFDTNSNKVNDAFSHVVDHSFLRRQQMNILNRFNKQAKRNFAAIMKLPEARKSPSSASVHSTPPTSVKSFKSSSNEKIENGLSHSSGSVTSTPKVNPPKRSTMANVQAVKPQTKRYSSLRKRSVGIFDAILKPPLVEGLEFPEDKSTKRFSQTHIEFRQLFGSRKTSSDCKGLNWNQMKTCGDEPDYCATECECRFHRNRT